MTVVLVAGHGFRSRVDSQDSDRRIGAEKIGPNSGVGRHRVLEQPVDEVDVVAQQLGRVADALDHERPVMHEELDVE